MESQAGWCNGPAELDWVLPEGLQQLVVGGDEAMVAEIIETFQRDTAMRLELLQSAVERGAREEVRAQAHAIKGGAAQVGVNGIAVVCRQIETRAREGEAAEIQELAARLATEFQAVARLIQTGNRWAIGR